MSTDLATCVYCSCEKVGNHGDLPLCDECTPLYEELYLNPYRFEMFCRKKRFDKVLCCFRYLYRSIHKKEIVKHWKWFQYPVFKYLVLGNELAIVYRPEEGGIYTLLGSLTDKEPSGFVNISDNFFVSPLSVLVDRRSARLREYT